MPHPSQRPCQPPHRHPMPVSACHADAIGIPCRRRHTMPVVSKPTPGHLFRPGTRRAPITPRPGGASAPRACTSSPAAPRKMRRAMRQTAGAPGKNRPCSWKIPDLRWKNPDLPQTNPDSTWTNRDSTQTNRDPTWKFCDPTWTNRDPTQKFCDSTQTNRDSTWKFCDSTQTFPDRTQTFSDSTQTFSAPTWKLPDWRCNSPKPTPTVPPGHAGPSVGVPWSCTCPPIFSFSAFQHFPVPARFPGQHHGLMARTKTSKRRTFILALSLLSVP